jgi:hypothetical protein
MKEINMKCPNCNTSLIRLSERSEPEGIRHDAYCKKCNKTFEVHKSGLMEKKIYHTDPCTWKDCPICSPSPKARVDWENLDEQIDLAVDFWFEDCSCEQGQCCNSCNLKMELSKIFKSAAFEKGREAR